LRVTYGALKGNVAHSNVVAYRTDPNFTALLINPKAYGSGLNLENTTDVVIYHKLNEQMNRQVIGRAQRPGRTSRLRIWYLFNENESLEQ
jgi:SNF2 family DNA or RNA helicase